MYITVLLHNELVINREARVRQGATPCDDAGVARSYLFAMWDGGGNLGPFLCLAERLQAAGHAVRAVAPTGLAGRLADASVDLVGSPEGWLPGAADVVAAADAHPPDVVIVDYMLTDALGGAERLGRPTVALVHTLYRELLTDGAPHPIGMAGPVERLNPARVAAGLAPLSTHADLLAAVDLVLVAAPRPLDAPGAVPANVTYAGPLLEGPGPDAAWAPPPGSGPLVVVSLGTAGDPAVEVPVLRRVLAALAELPVRAFVTVADYVDRAAIGAVPPNATVSGYVRHAAVLPHADLLVTHAGLGSVVAALAHGVPMVALPLDRDQPENARALVRMGAGVALMPDAPADEIRAAAADQLRRSTSPRITVDPGPAIARLESL
jgi:MGT family glycosyltransferase